MVGLKFDEVKDMNYLVFRTTLKKDRKIKRDSKEVSSKKEGDMAKEEESVKNYTFT